MDDKNKRSLSDEDVKALIDELESRLEQHVGQGLLSLLWKAAILGVLIVIAWGMNSKIF